MLKKLFMEEVMITKETSHGGHTEETVDHEGNTMTLSVMEEIEPK